MSTIMFCDKCNKQKNETSDKNEWVQISLRSSSTILKKCGFDSMWPNFELCPKCSKDMINLLLKNLNQSTA